jgi:hypothetical protein
MVYRLPANRTGSHGKRSRFEGFIDIGQVERDLDNRFHRATALRIELCNKATAYAISNWLSWKQMPKIGMKMPHPTESSIHLKKMFRLRGTDQAIWDRSEKRLLTHENCNRNFG